MPRGDIEKAVTIESPIREILACLENWRLGRIQGRLGEAEKERNERLRMQSTDEGKGINPYPSPRFGTLW